MAPDKTARTGNRSAWWQSAICRFCWIAAPLWNCERFAPNHRRRFGISRVVFEGSCISPRDTAVSFRLYLFFLSLLPSSSPPFSPIHLYHAVERGGNGFVRVSFFLLFPSSFFLEGESFCKLFEREGKIKIGRLFKRGEKRMLKKFLETFFFIYCYSELYTISWNWKVRNSIRVILEY